MILEQYTAKAPFSSKHLLCLQEYTEDEILQILALALDLKKKQKEGIPHKLLEGKTLAMIFAKSSTRTRVSFETGIFQLGGMGLYLNTGDIQLGRGESIQDTAETISRMVDGIMIRTFSQQDVVELAKYSRVPVINGLTDAYHPCQALGDLLTLYENKAMLKGLKMAFIGDGNNVCHSLMIACTKLGVSISVAHPEGYAPDKLIQEFAKINAKKTGCSVEITTDAKEAARDADAVYTDVWASMGQESEAQERKAFFEPYQVNAALMKIARENAIFMHCLPAHVGEEVTAEVMYGPQSVVFEEAENRLHAQKAVMAILMK
ncbi:MAG: ornithine carbamoyltransferase [Bacillota bacterium]